MSGWNRTDSQRRTRVEILRKEQQRMETGSVELHAGLVRSYHGHGHHFNPTAQPTVQW